MWLFPLLVTSHGLMKSRDTGEAYTTKDMWERTGNWGAVGLHYNLLIPRCADCLVKKAQVLRSDKPSGAGRMVQWVKAPAVQARPLNLISVIHVCWLDFWQLDKNYRHLGRWNLSWKKIASIRLASMQVRRGIFFDLWLMRKGPAHCGNLPNHCATSPALKKIF